MHYYGTSLLASVAHVVIVTIFANGLTHQTEHAFQECELQPYNIRFKIWQMSSGLKDCSLDLDIFALL